MVEAVRRFVQKNEARCLNVLCTVHLSIEDMTGNSRLSKMSSCSDVVRRADSAMPANVSILNASCFASSVTE
jgi:hypothetical protein